MATTASRKIRNNTPHPLKIQGADNQWLNLAPLEVRWLSAEKASVFDLSAAKFTGLITESGEPPRELEETLLGFAGLLGFMLAVAAAVVSGVVEENLGHPAPNWLIWGGGLGAWILSMALVVIFKTKSKDLVLRFLLQMLSLTVILAISVGLPVLTVYYFGEGKTLLASAPSAELFSRLLQVGFIAIASLLPTLLFFLFDRYQLNTIRERVYRDLFRLDRRLRARSDIDASYGTQLRETYGPEDQESGRLAPGNRWPVMICAIVITVGWLAVFSPVGSVDAAAIDNPLVPRPTALAFGFLGAYFFALQLIARRYSRRDLKPKTYGYITIRILSVAVLSWVLEMMFGADSTVKLVLAFLTGIVPEEFPTLLREKFRGSAPEKVTPESERHPLTRLEGIDLYDRARLEQEGIVNIESLAHHELIQLVLETQVPMPRLVDWMDQAILYLHVTAEPTSQGSTPAGTVLRQYGIRTATDLLSCWSAADERKELDHFRALLGNSKPYRLEVIRDTLLDDEWLERIKDWRDETPRETFEIYALPNTYEAKLSYAKLLEWEKRNREALQMLGETLELKDTAEARLQRAHLLSTSSVPSLRNRDAAREDALQAFNLGQGDPEILLELIPIFESVGDPESAIRAADMAIGLLGDPRDDDSRERLKSLKRKRAELGKKQQSASAAGG